MTGDVQFKTEPLLAFAGSNRYLVGVSGGRDSVALLHWLFACGYRRLIVCHLDHQLRGAAGRADARFVQRLAAGMGLRFVVGSADVRELARQTKQSLETAGRTARYRFFGKIASQRKCRTLFLGHHADDLVETFLMNLFRGAGPTGFSGMRIATSRRVAGIDLTIVRPLLPVWRKEIDQYVKAHRIEFRDDATNENLDPVRNRVRKRVIPYIEKQLGRNVRTAIWRAATIAGDEADWIAGLVETEVSQRAQLDAKKLRLQPRALQRRIIQRWLQARGVGDLDFELIERVRALIDPKTGVAKTNLPRDRHVRRRTNAIFIEPMPPPRRAKT